MTIKCPWAASVCALGPTAQGALRAARLRPHPAANAGFRSFGGKQTRPGGHAFTNGRLQPLRPTLEPRTVPTEVKGRRHHTSIRHSSKPIKVLYAGHDSESLRLSSQQMSTLSGRRSGPGLPCCAGPALNTTLKLQVQGKFRVNIRQSSCCARSSQLV